MRVGSYLLALWVACELYEWFAYSVGIEDFRTIDWRLPLRVSVVVVPLAVLTLQLLRQRLIRLDLHVTYLPLAAWFLAAVAVKFIGLLLFHGEPALGPYGADKGMFNLFAVEPPLVLVLQSFYLLRFPWATGNPTVDESRAKLLLRSVLVAAVCVAVFVPPLPD